MMYTVSLLVQFVSIAGLKSPRNVEAYRRSALLEPLGQEMDAKFSLLVHEARSTDRTQIAVDHKQKDKISASEGDLRENANLEGKERETADEYRMRKDAKERVQNHNTRTIPSARFRCGNGSFLTVGTVRAERSDDVSERVRHPPISSQCTRWPCVVIEW